MIANSVGDLSRAEVDSATREDLEIERFDREYLLENTPVRITGMAKGWSATEKWSPEYFAVAMRSEVATVNFNKNEIFDFNETATTGPVLKYRLPFRDIVDKVTSQQGGCYYIQQSNLSDFAQLAADVQLPYLLDNTKKVAGTNLWFGGRGCKSPLHHDSRDNFLVQIFGRKRLMLIPASCSPLLYPAIGQALPHCSMVNVFDPDFTKYPEYARAYRHSMSVELGPGDAVFIPAKWWHAVETTAVSASVNFWWDRIASSES
jgi:hypothetical protein